jgi:1,4-dihydroxy-2-naphthoate octaprenyltransferase
MRFPSLINICHVIYLHRQHPLSEEESAECSGCEPSSVAMPVPVGVVWCHKRSSSIAATSTRPMTTTNDKSEEKEKTINGIAANWRTTLSAFITLGRPKFLPYSAVLYAFGASIYLHMHDNGNGIINWNHYWYGQLFVTCLHIMTHYCNEYFDYEADCANQSPTAMTGGSRILVNGLISPATSLRTSMILGLIAITLSSSFISLSSQFLGYTIVITAWFYTSPPIRFNYRGLGELCVATLLNVCVPMLSYLVQQDAANVTSNNVSGIKSVSSAASSTSIALLLLPGAIMQVCRMMLMNLMDYDGDIATNKHTLPTMIGRHNVKYCYAIGHFIAYSIIVAITYTGELPILAAILLFGITLPLSIWQANRLWRNIDRHISGAGSIAFWASTHVSLIPAAITFGLLFNIITSPAPFDWSSIALVSMAPLVYVFIILIPCLISKLRGASTTAAAAVTITITSAHEQERVD